MGSGKILLAPCWKRGSWASPGFSSSGQQKQHALQSRCDARFVCLLICTFVASASPCALPNWFFSLSPSVLGRLPVKVKDFRNTPSGSGDGLLLLLPSFLSDPCSSSSLPSYPPRSSSRLLLACDLQSSESVWQGCLPDTRPPTPHFLLHFDLFLAWASSSRPYPDWAGPAASSRHRDALTPLRRRSWGVGSPRILTVCIIPCHRHPTMESNHVRDNAAILN